MRGCRHARHRVLLEVDGRIPLEERFLLEEHLRTCDDCARFHADALAVEESVAGQPEPPSERVDVQAAVRAVRQAIQSGGSERLPAAHLGLRVRRPRWRVGLAAAALLLVSAALGIRALTRSSSGASEHGASPEPVVAIDRAPGVRPVPGDEPRGAEDPAEVERALRTRLLEAFADFEPEGAGAEPCVARFEELAEPYERWPVERIAEAILDDPDPEAARAAARFLGLRGDRISGAKLAAVVRRPELGRAAVAALGDLGEPGVPGLARALSIPDLEESALAELAEVGGEAAARTLHAACLALAEAPGQRDDLDERGGRAGSRDRDARLAAYLTALSDTGEAAVDLLLSLVTDGVGTAELVVPRLLRVDGGGRALLQLLDSGRHETELLLEALAVLQPVEGLAWVEDRVGESRHREQALASLARWNGTAPLSSLMRLDAEGRVEHPELVETLRRLAARDEERLVRFARRVLEEEPMVERERYLELLLVCGSSHAAPALVEFALSDGVAADARQWAALAVAELGDEEDAVRLRDGLPALDGESRRLHAASLVTIQRLLGDEGVDDALVGMAPRAARDVRRALRTVASIGTDTIGLHRVARALDGAWGQDRIAKRDSIP